MIFRIHTLYLFLAFALSALLFMQNPIIYEIKYTEGKETWMEFGQIWRTVSIDKISNKPQIINETLHIICMVIMILGSLFAVVLSHLPRWQLMIFTSTAMASTVLFVCLMLNHRLRLAHIDDVKKLGILSPHILWFVLLFMFQTFAFSSLLEAYKQKSKA